MTKRPKIDLEELSQPQRELSEEEADAIRGGATFFAGKKPIRTQIVSDPCEGGEGRRRF